MNVGIETEQGGSPLTQSLPFVFWRIYYALGPVLTIYSPESGIRKNRMEEENIAETDISVQSEPKTSRLAIASMVFGILGPLSGGAMWIASVNNFVIRTNFVVALFSCGVPSMLGLILGMKSLEQIDNSEGQLLGREYAIAGVAISVVWIVLVLLGLLLPALFSINS
jgi:hypothetical protein